VSAANVPVGYAAVGGFNANTPTKPGHVFQVTCTATCGSFTWADKTGNLPDIPVDSIIVNPNIPKQVFAGTDWGLYYTNDITVSSPSWSRFDTGLPHSMIWDMAIDRGSTTLSVWTRSRGAYVWPLPTSLPLTLTSVVSRKTHGSLTPPGDLPLNSGTPATIECRSGGIPSGNHTLVFTFGNTLNASNPVGSITATATTSSGTQNVTANGNLGTDTHQYLVTLSAVPNASHVNITLTGVTDTSNATGNFSTHMDVLLGDVNSTDRTDAGDVTQVRNRTVTIPDTTDPTSFRYDVNISGRIDAGDVTTTRNATVTVLP
jgi:hypothetical protein